MLDGQRARFRQVHSVRIATVGSRCQQLALRCVYAISRGEFGVAPQFVNPELVDTIRLDQRLIMTTTPFDERLRRGENPELAMRLQRVVSLIRDMRDLDAAVSLVETLTTENWASPSIVPKVLT